MPSLDYQNLNPEEEALIHHYVPRLQDHALIPALGPSLVAALAPEITSSWQTRDIIPGHPEETQDMGTTQVLPYWLWRAQDLVPSRFVQGLIAYCLSE